MDTDAGELPVPNSIREAQAVVGAGRQHDRTKGNVVPNKALSTSPADTDEARSFNPLHRLLAFSPVCGPLTPSLSFLSGARLMVAYHQEPCLTPFTAAAHA